MYHNAQAELDVGGSRLELVLLECGVIQGNPLSPLLFNIYLDGAVRELEDKVGAYRRSKAGGEPPLGVTFPRARWARGGLDARTLGAVLCDEKTDDWELFADAADRLTHLFYADDGVLMAHDPQQLQQLSDWLRDALAPLGLAVNAKKTKYMVVAEPNRREAAVAAAVAHPLKVGRDVVELVNDFDYLGVRLNSCWNWKGAWKDAVARAGAAHYRANMSAWDEEGTLDSLLTYARNKIFCHFTYIAAITGAGGRASTRYWGEAVELQHAVLRQIVGYRFAKAEIVAIEAGLWDLQSFTDKLVLRFRCKVSTSDVESMAHRAMVLSFASTCEEDMGTVQQAERSHTLPDVVHRQSWAQQAAAAAWRFEVNVPLVRQMRVSAVVALQAHVPLVIGGPGPKQWESIDPTDSSSTQRLAAVRACGLRAPDLRLVLPGDELKELRVGVNCWRWPQEDAVRVDTALREWTPTLKAACYAALQRRGNACRQRLVRAFIQEQIDADTHYRLWAMNTASAVRQPYWYWLDTTAARRVARVRAGQACNEGHVRSAEFCAKVAKGFEVRLPRIEDRNRRACYRCEPIRASCPDVYWADSVEHMLVKCTCSQMQTIRVRVRQELSQLAQETGARLDFSDDTTLLTALLLTTGVTPVGGLQRLPAAPGAAPELRRDSPQLEYRQQQARATSVWVASLTDPWIDAQRDAYAYRRQQRRGGGDDPDGMPGGKLVLMVGRAVQDMWMAHNRVCRARTNPEYQLRARDAEPNRPFPTEAAGRKQARDARRKQAAKVQRARAAVERAKLPEEVAKRLARDRAKADKAMAAEVRRLQVKATRVAALVVVAQEAHAAAQRRAEEAQRGEREAVAMAAAASGPGCTRHDRALLQAAAKTKCAETVEAGQDLARAATQLRRLLRLADVAQRDVAVAASSVGGDGLPLLFFI